MSIYKACDVRGSAATELSPELYFRWGEVLGEWAGQGGKFVVGGDTRASTPRFMEALVQGLCQSGVDCVCLGHVPTPLVYYAQRRLRAAGCAMVTASHNPATENGLKWIVGESPPSPEEVQRLRAQRGETGGEDVEGGELGRRGGRDAGRKDSEISTSPRPHVSTFPPRRAQTPRSLDVSFDYVAWLQEAFVDSMRSRLHVVIDPMYGAWAGRARRYLQAVFPECLISVLHDAADPEFGGCPPDCSRSEHLEELCDAMYRHHADIGIALDGDGDRLALVDHQGVPLTAEETTCVLLEGLGEKLRGKPFIYDLKFSDRVPETARRLGAEPLVERSGHAFFHGRMRRAAAPFGAEISGHYFFAELDGGDDGLYAACRVLAILTETALPLDRLRRRCPSVYMTPELRVPLADSRQEQVLLKIREVWSAFPQNTFDGVRIDLPGAWILARSSMTEAALTFRFEAADWSELDQLLRRFCVTLPEVGEALWACYEAAQGRA